MILKNSINISSSWFLFFQHRSSCYPNPCLNGGKCTTASSDVPFSDFLLNKEETKEIAPPLFKCYCQPRYYGNRCQFDSGNEFPFSWFLEEEIYLFIPCEGFHIVTLILPRMTNVFKVSLNLILFLLEILVCLYHENTT